jgi:hypothetical protein
MHSILLVCLNLPAVMWILFWIPINCARGDLSLIRFMGVKDVCLRFNFHLSLVKILNCGDLDVRVILICTGLSLLSRFELLLCIWRDLLRVGFNQWSDSLSMSIGLNFAQ